MYIVFFIMAIHTLTKTIKFLLDRKVSGIYRNTVPKSHYQNPLFRINLRSYVNFLPYIHSLYHAHLNNLQPCHMNSLKKNVSTYDNLLQQAISQVRYCSKADSKVPAKSPKGRHQYHKETEDSINEQINAELNAAFAYLSMACYFGRTEVALAGCQGYFMNMHQEEMGHAVTFMNYQLLRGAHVMLSPVNVPECQDWQSVINAFTVAAEMEKSIKEKLICVFNVADKHKDLEVMDIISTQFMEEQNRSICELARLLTRAKMSENSVGEYLFDQFLYNSFVAKSKEDNLMYKIKLNNAQDKVYK